MFRSFTPALLLSAAGCFAVPVLAAKPATTLEIQVAGPGKPISPDLFGIFFEDLNYAADGGLYGELIRNRSFEYTSSEQATWNELSFWTLEQRGDGDGSIHLKTAAPLHTNNPHYVSLVVKKPGGGVGLVNPGYDGIPVVAGETYELTFFAHQQHMGEMWSSENSIEGRTMPVTVRLESTSGETLAAASLQVTGREWRKYRARLSPGHTDPAARLVFLAHAQGGFALDEISLFPTKTFKDRPNGLRRDLAQAIANLKPRFVRFPGGCLVHGDGLNNIYNWKHTVGPVEQRKGQRNLWGYHQSVGLGYYEYFQFCEDIGAKPLPVVAAGVCCQNSDNSPGMGQRGLPLHEMDGYIQDVLDLIEWANGPATSTWGARRAAAGHPEPFGLKYLGLGNEDKITPEFEERFRMIAEALKAKHPEIVLIGTSGPFPDGEDFDKGWAFSRKLNLELVDEHYYRSPDWFWENLKRYDAYDRQGPRVYVGEYAAHEKDRRSTLRSALAEAAAMVGFERNGDVVQFSSYAPLLARRGNTQWTPDLIYFTATDVYPTINYYVQQLFGQHAGDEYLETRISGEESDSRVTASTVRDSHTGEVILKLVNGASAQRPVTLEWKGLGTATRRAHRVQLAHTNPEVVNEDIPAPAVRPARDEIAVEPSMTYTLPANSLTVLRLPAE